VLFNFEHLKFDPEVDALKFSTLVIGNKSLELLGKHITKKEVAEWWKKPRPGRMLSSAAWLYLLVRALQLGSGN